MALAAARAEAEEAYGNKLQEIPVTYVPKRNGFGRDEGASLRKAYEGIITEMGQEGKHHIQVAESIRRMVLVPFGKWADDHKQRVDYSHSVLKGKLKHYEKELQEVHKCQKKYFNKCRVLEDLMSEEAAENEETDDTISIEPSKKSEEISGEVVELPQNDPAEEAQQTSQDAEAPSADSVSSPKPANTVQRKHVRNSSIVSSLAGLSVDGTKEQDVPGPITLGNASFGVEDAMVLFQRLLDQIPQTKIKVPLLGVYDHVSSGDSIVTWVQANVPSCDNLASTERFGQSLVDGGYLRLVGNLGSKFANSSVMHYQWRKKAYAMAGRSEDPSGDGTPIMGGYLGETINSYITNANSDEPPETRLRREITALDLKYRQAVSSLDKTRCDLEESITDHFKFMDRCEFDRLKAVKAVFLDFLAVLSNVVPTIQSTVDKLLLYQETVHPANDLRYILESYATGPFTPKVTVYDNYYNASEDQTFGVDLELRCRGDRKKVPMVVSAILGHMDALYPELENDEVRLGVWTVSVPLKASHSLRRELNDATPQAFPREVLGQYDPPVVASVLKLYLVELPDSLIPSQHYDVIKTIYAQHANDEDPRQRIAAIQNTFTNLRVSNIATLDAIIKHLTRLVTITSAGPQYIAQLSQEFSHCILRPRSQSALTIGDRHVYLLIHDLLTHGAQVFKELKRQNSNTSERLPIKPLSRLARRSVDASSPKSLPDAPTTTVQPTSSDKENQMSPEPEVKQEEVITPPATTEADGQSGNPIVID